MKQVIRAITITHSGRRLAALALTGLLAVDSARAGELLYNGNMEDGSNGWTMAATGASVMQGWAAKDGTNGMLFGNWFSGASGWLRQTVSASPANGSVLLFSLDGLCGSEFRSTTRDVYLRLQLLNGGSPVLTVSNNIYAAFTNTTSWNEWSVGYINSGGLTFNQTLVEVGFAGGNGVGGDYRVARWDNASLSQNEPAPTVSKTNVFILLGQSNMSGWNSFYSYTFYASANVAHPRVKQLSRRDPATQTNNPFVGRIWRDAVDPLTHHDFRRNCTITNEADPYYVYNWMGVGPGKTFAETLANAWPDSEIRLVPNAHGGTAIRWWQKTNSETLYNTDDLASGDADGWGNDYGTNLYQSTLDRIRYATNYGTLAGVIWHQGEGDSGNADHAAAYSNNLNQLIQDLRADLGRPDLPFIVGEMGDFFVNAGESYSAHAGPVLEALQTLPAHQAATACVDSEGLEGQSDNHHFTGNAQREFGRRYGVAMYRVMEPMDIAEDGRILSGHEGGEPILVTLQGDAFPASLSPASWTLSGVPSGLSVASVGRLDATSAVVVIGGNATNGYVADIYTARVSAAASQFTSGVARAAGLGVTLLMTGVKDSSFDQSPSPWQTSGSCVIAPWGGPAASGGMVMPTWTPGSQGTFSQDCLVTPADGTMYAFSILARLGNMRSTTSNIWMKIELLDGTNAVASNERKVYGEMLLNASAWTNLSIGVTSLVSSVEKVRVSMGYSDSSGANQSEYDLAALTQSGTPVFDSPVYTISPTNGATLVATNAAIQIVFDRPMRHTNGLPLVSGSAALSNLVVLKQTDASGADLPFTISADAGQSNITVQAVGLPAGSTVYFALAGGGLMDFDGNPATATNITFTTEDAAPVGPAALVNGGFEDGPAGSDVVPTGWWTYGNVAKFTWAGLGGSNGVAFKNWSGTTSGGFGQQVSVDTAYGDIFYFSIRGSRDSNFVSATSSVWLQVEALDGTATNAVAYRNVYTQLMAAAVFSWPTFTIGYTNTFPSMTAIRVSVHYGAGQGDLPGDRTAKWDAASLIQTNRQPEDDSVYGIPLAWLEQNGLVTNGTTASAQEVLDHDGDGFVGWEEFVAGTQPTNDASRFIVQAYTSSTPTAAGYVLTWPSTADRRYRVEAATNLAGAYATLSNNIAATPPLNTFTAQWNSAVLQGFRVRVWPQ